MLSAVVISTVNRARTPLRFRMCPLLEGMLIIDFLFLPMLCFPKIIKLYRSVQFLCLWEQWPIIKKYVLRYWLVLCLQMKRLVIWLKCIVWACAVVIVVGQSTSYFAIGGLIRTSIQWNLTKLVYSLLFQILTKLIYSSLFQTGRNRFSFFCFVFFFVFNHCSVTDLLGPVWQFLYEPF